jgi:dTDP-4-amino-4,6-dideoxygalactose transaminase
MKPWIGDEEAEAAAEVLRSGWVAQGRRVAEFEQLFARRVGAAEGVAVSSCTTALHLALHLLGVGPGDDVVVPSLSFIATANVVRYVGARPVFADVDPDTANVTAESLAEVLTDRTRAIIAVHQGGMPLVIGRIRELASSRGIHVVEDAACAAGSTYEHAPVGSGAALAAWSFHPRKLITTGEGGMLTTDRTDWADRLRRLREHGMNISAAERHRSTAPVIESYVELGFNFRMTDIQAAVGIVQVGKLPSMVSRRRELASRYQDLLADVPGVNVVRDHPQGASNFQSFWVELTRDFPLSRDELLMHLAREGVSARPGIMAAHRQPAYKGYRWGKLPYTERLTDNSLILPLYHTMSQDEQSHVVEMVRRAAAEVGG